jgi:hypothetical protein
MSTPDPRAPERVNPDIPKPNRKFMDAGPERTTRMGIPDPYSPGSSDRLAFGDNFEAYVESVPKTHFSIALALLKEGKRVSRLGWNGKHQWIELQEPDALSKMTLPYLFIKTVQGDRVPWLASQTDLLAEDWFQLP